MNVSRTCGRYDWFMLSIDSLLLIAVEYWRESHIEITRSGKDYKNKTLLRKLTFAPGEPSYYNHLINESSFIQRISQCINNSCNQWNNIKIPIYYIPTTLSLPQKQNVTRFVKVD